MSFEFEYFYGNETEQFSFYRIPKMLFKEKMFKDVSAEAKVLYGLMLDRTGLSAKNGWLDEENRVYIVYTIAEIMEDLNCADQKAGKLLSELDTVKGIGLIERKRQGLGKPNIIYVKNFYSASRLQNSENHDSREVKITNQEILESQFKNSENHDSGQVNITNQEYPNSLPNDNNINNNKNNNTDFSETPMRRAKTTPILVLSSLQSQAERLDSLKAGAHAYMGKPYTLEECLAQAQSLMQLYADLHPKTDECFTLVFGKDLIIEPETRRVFLKEKEISCTRKEFDLLLCFASNPGRVFSREQLYDLIWDEESAFNIDDVVKAHIKRLRRKLSDSEIE